MKVTTMKRKKPEEKHKINHWNMMKQHYQDGWPPSILKSARFWKRTSIQKHLTIMMSSGMKSAVRLTYGKSYRQATISKKPIKRHKKL
jgi:hypothetical protein